MLTTQKNQAHNVQAWYFEPVYPDNVDNTVRNKLEWVSEPKPFKCSFGKLTKTGFNILSNYVATSTGLELITESTIDFDDKGKIAFGKIAPALSEASKITKEGITTVPTPRSSLLGTRFTTTHDSKVIKVG